MMKVGLTGEGGGGRLGVKGRGSGGKGGGFATGPIGIMGDRVAFGSGAKGGRGASAMYFLSQPR